MAISRKERKQKTKKRSKLIYGVEKRPRVVISKTNLFLIAQAIDDSQGHTMVYISTADLEKKTKIRTSKKNIAYAKMLGKEFAKGLKEKGLENIFFDCNGYPYHGNIEAFCQTLRQEGIVF